MPPSDENSEDKVTLEELMATREGRLRAIANGYENQATLFSGRRREWRLRRAQELRDLADEDGMAGTRVSLVH